MRILHVCPALDPAWAYGQTPQRVAQLAREQAALGHDVTVLTTDARAPHERLSAGRSRVDGVTVIRVRNVSGAVRTWLHLSTPLRMTARLRSIIREGTPDIVHGHELRTIENLIAVRTLPAAIPLVVSLHETTHAAGHEPIERVWDTVVGDRLLARIDAALTASADEAAQFRALCETRRHPILDDRLIVQRHGVDRVLPSATIARSEARRRFSLDDGPVVLFMDRSADPQDIDLLLAAFLDVANTIPRAQLLVVGSNRGRVGAAHARIAEHSLAGRVHFAGHVVASDRDLAFGAADLLALPFEGVASLAAGTEGVAVGLPLMVDRRGALDIVDTHDTGWTVEGLGGWAEALHAALIDPVSLAAKRERAETLALSFAWSAVAADVVRVYERLRAGASATRPPASPDGV